jgi:type IV pilus assembly protein PilN
MIRINLLPIKAIKAEFSRRQELFTAGLTLGLALVLTIGHYLFQSYRLSGREKELEGLRSEIQTLTVKVKGVDDLERKIKDLKGKHKVIEELNTKKTGPVRVMESLSSATPPKLWLTRFRETGGNLALDGLAIDHQTIADFLKALSSSAYFKNVNLVETTQIQKDGVPLKKFSIKSTLVYESPPPQQTEVISAPKEGKQG